MNSNLGSCFSLQLEFDTESGKNADAVVIGFAFDGIETFAVGIQSVQHIHNINKCRKVEALNLKHIIGTDIEAYKIGEAFIIVGNDFLRIPFLTGGIENIGMDNIFILWLAGSITELCCQNPFFIWLVTD